MAGVGGVCPQIGVAGVKAALYWSMSITSDRFTRLNILPDEPGFYDSPAFLKVEQSEPNLLHDYAKYVFTREYTDVYLENAAPIIKDVSEFLYTRLVKDGRQGACIDMASTLSRFLEREGIWNVAVSGALRIDTPIGSTNFGPITFGDSQAMAAHAWVYAPPFEVIDLTIKQQPYPEKEILKYLPGYVIEKFYASGKCEPEDFFDRSALSKFISVKGRMPKMSDVYQIDSGIKKGVLDFRSVEFLIDKTKLTYLPIAGIFPDLPLETMANLILSGKKPFEIYQEYKLNV